MKNGKKNRSVRRANRNMSEHWVFSVSRSLHGKIYLKIPIEVTEISVIELNGVPFYKKGTVKEIVRVAPLLYPDSHFKEVNGLVANKHYSKEAALKDISEKYGYDFDNFRRAYYDRKGSKMGVEELVGGEPHCYRGEPHYFSESD